MERLAPAVLSCFIVACATPRSAVLGQTAAALGSGRSEVALATGVNAHFESANSSTNGVTVPTYEGNLHFGLSDDAGLNLHLSPAGFQPGVKVTLLRGDVAFAIMPEAGIGLATSSGSSTSTTLFEFIGGAKFLLSHSRGAYGGIGYDFQYLSSSSSGSETQTLTSHAISFAVGYDVGVGGVRVRPEFSMIYSPSNSTKVANISQPNLTQFYLLPNVTVALQTPARR